jgi:hypothetical protein
MLLTTGLTSRKTTAAQSWSIGNRSCRSTMSGHSSGPSIETLSAVRLGLGWARHLAACFELRLR